MNYKRLISGLLFGICLVTLGVSNTYAADIAPIPETVGETVASDPTTQFPPIIVENLVEQEHELLRLWFSDAAFVGNSTSVGLTTFFGKKENAYLGNPKVLAVTSYSFKNDNGTKEKYRLSYNDFNGKAKDVIAASGAKKVFINMGTNDLWGGPDKAYDEYVAYIDGIREANPGILIIIESTTPVYTGSEKDGLNNENIDILNQKMQALCEVNPDMLYIDISTALKDETGGMKAEYSSDKFVHLTNAGYKVWIDQVITAIKPYILPF